MAEVEFLFESLAVLNFVTNAPSNENFISFTNYQCKNGYQLPGFGTGYGNEFWNRVRVPVLDTDH